MKFTKNQKILGAIGIILIFVLVFSQALSIANFTTLSVSKTTENGKDIILVTGFGGVGADELTGTLSKTQFPDWNTNTPMTIKVTRQNPFVTYLLRDAPAGSDIFTYQVASSCEGQYPFGSCPLLKETFAASCVQGDNTAILIDYGELLNPRWKCYKRVSAWKISTAGQSGAVFDPAINVSLRMDGYSFKNVILTNRNLQGNIETTNGVIVGTVYAGSFVNSLQNIPPESGIFALRAPNSGDSISEMKIVYGPTLETLVRQAANDFTTCLNAKAKTASSVVLGPSIGYWGIGFPVATTGTFNADYVTCFEQFNTKINNLPNTAKHFEIYNNNPTIIRVDTNSRKLLIRDNYKIPIINLRLYAEKIGITRPIAIPGTLTCDKDLTILPQFYDGAIKINVNNVGADGVIFYSVSCTGSVTPLIGSGQVNVNSRATVPIYINVHSGGSGGTGSCTITAKSTDLSTSKSVSCMYKSNKICDNAPLPGFVLNENCENVCTLTQEMCGNKKLYAPSTGYPNQCYCGTVDPYNCPIGQHWDGVKCVVDDSGSNKTCIPFFEKSVTSFPNPIFGFFGIGGSLSCVWDFMNIGLTLIAVGTVIFFYGENQKKKDTKKFGIATIVLGILLLIANFALENSLLLILGGAGIFLVLLLLVLIYMIVKGMI